MEDAALGPQDTKLSGAEGLAGEMCIRDRAQHIGEVALCTVGDEDLVLVQLGAAACVVALNGLLELRTAIIPKRTLLSNALFIF